MTKAVRVALAGVITVGTMVLACVPTKESKRKQKKNTLEQKVQDAADVVKQGTVAAKCAAEGAVESAKKAAEDVAKINEEKEAK